MNTEPDPLDVEIGARVRSRREAVDMTQGALARVLGEGWHRPALSLIESGKQGLRVRELGVLADALGCPVARLLPPGWRK